VNEGRKRWDSVTCSFSVFYFFIAADLFRASFTELYMKSRQVLPTDGMAKRLESSIGKYARGESVIDRGRCGGGRLRNINEFIEFRNRKTLCILQMKVTVLHVTQK
jgi:hypothetical protein